MKELFDYDVYDRNDQKVGTVENVWAGPGDQIGFIGISTGWLGLGKNHLIPADEITVDDQDGKIHVPYDEDLIKSSPSFESTQDLGDKAEANTYAHYGLSGRRYSGDSGFSPSTGYVGDETDYPKGFSSEDTGYAEGSRGFTDQPLASDYEEGAESIEIPLAQEKLHVEKRDKGSGEVRLRKVVRTEVVNQPVELRHEDVVIERVSGGSLAPGEKPFGEETYSIPVREEEAFVEKTVESAGTVRVRKVGETSQENISEEVRREDVEVEREHEHGYSGRRE
jgi:uncharacterized protein (TIGR02271 family)